MSAGPTLSRRRLNRALLSRQLLLARERRSALDALEHLAGMQAQLPGPPLVGLWSRLAGYAPGTLETLVAKRQVVRVPAMRATLHVLTARDYLAHHATLRLALRRAMSAYFGSRVRGVDVAGVVRLARGFLDEAPARATELRRFLGRRHPDLSDEALAFLVRSELPLALVLDRGAFENPGGWRFVAAESWLARAPAPTPDVRALLRRYLRAFGPASVRDFQAWSGLTKVAPVFEALAGELARYRSPEGEELFDLRGAALADEDTAAPVRFLGAYDNQLVAYVDRSRIVDPAHRSRVYLSAGRVVATVLVDGFVSARWALASEDGRATLTIEPFVPLSRRAKDAMAEEGDALARFLAPEAARRGLRFAK